MTQAQINTLTNLISETTKAKPGIEPEEFISQHWQPFLQTLDLQDRRMAWQVYLKTQANDLHTIVQFLQTLTPAQLDKIRPTLEKIVDTALKTPPSPRYSHPDTPR